MVDDWYRDSSQKIFISSSLEFFIIEKCKPELGSEKERYYLIEAYLKEGNKLLNQHITIKWQ